MIFAMKFTFNGALDDDSFTFFKLIDSDSSSDYLTISFSPSNRSTSALNFDSSA